MSVYQRCPQHVADLANEILCEFPTHKPLLDAKVKIDYVFAFAKVDGHGNPVGAAIRVGGYQALGMAKIIRLKDRSLGRGDGEITLDGDWWNKTDVKKHRALLDHELHHFQVKIDRRGLVRDDLNRPVLVMRRHDYDFGWFKIIAERHGEHSCECHQAAQMMAESGQLFWPEIAGRVNRKS